MSGYIVPVSVISKAYQTPEDWETSERHNRKMRNRTGAGAAAGGAAYLAGSAHNIGRVTSGRMMSPAALAASGLGFWGGVGSLGASAMYASRRRKDARVGQMKRLGQDSKVTKSDRQTWADNEKNYRQGRNANLVGAGASTGLALGAGTSNLRRLRRGQEMLPKTVKLRNWGYAGAAGMGGMAAVGEGLRRRSRRMGEREKLLDYVAMRNGYKGPATRPVTKAAGTEMELYRPSSLAPRAVTPSGLAVPRRSRINPKYLKRAGLLLGAGGVAVGGAEVARRRRRDNRQSIPAGA